MSATIIFDNRHYVSRLEQAGFTRPQAEAQAEMLTEYSETLRAALQPLLRFYEETAHKDLATRSDVLDTRLEIERVRSETEKVRAEVEKIRADLKIDIETTRADLKTDIETTRAEVEKIRADLKIDIETTRADLKADIETTRAEVEKVRAELKADIETTRAEVEKVRAELKVDIEKVRADLKSDMAKVKYDLLKWQIGIGIALVAIMATGFGWLGFSVFPTRQREAEAQRRQPRPSEHTTWILRSDRPYGVQRKAFQTENALVVTGSGTAGTGAALTRQRIPVRGGRCPDDTDGPVRARRRPAGYAGTVRP